MLRSKSARLTHGAYSAEAQAFRGLLRTLKEKQKECDELKIQRDLERQRADVAVQNSLTGLQVMQALRDVAYDRRPPWQQLDSPPEHYSVFPPAQGPSHGEGANPH